MGLCHHPGLFLLIVKSKIYYLAPVYPVLLAGGAVAIERWPISAAWGG